MYLLQSVVDDRLSVLQQDWLEEKENWNNKKARLNKDLFLLGILKYVNSMTSLGIFLPDIRNKRYIKKKKSFNTKGKWNYIISYQRSPFGYATIRYRRIYWLIYLLTVSVSRPYAVGCWQWWIGKEVKGRCRALILRHYPAFSWSKWGKYRKSIVML
jgi:hypothetical protein